MGGAWSVPARVLPASSLLPEVHPLTPELCMVQATVMEDVKSKIKVVADSVPELHGVRGGGGAALRPARGAAGPGLPAGGAGGAPRPAGGAAGRAAQPGHPWRGGHPAGAAAGPGHAAAGRAPAAPGPLPPSRGIPCGSVLPYGPKLLHEGRPGARAPARARAAGFGSFVDKTVLPFVSTVPSKLRHPCPTRLERCQPPFSFHHVLSLTGDAKAFEREVGRQSVSGNLDSPEGGFDAILQAALCQEQIGWRNVSRLLVFTSDDTFHTAGDGKLGGIFMPSDGHCHLDSNGLYSRSPEFDYPSVGQVAQALSAANIQPIFAVTSATLPVYQELSKLIPKSAVGELSEDSSNVVQLIMDAYNSLSSTVTLEHEHALLPPGVHISYESQCGGPEKRQGEAGDRGQCNHVRINQTVNFLVTLQATHCLPEPHLLRFRARGFSEELTVELHTLCDCNCSDTQLQAPHCSDGQGHLQCGVCSCVPGHLGRLCECSEAELSSPDLESGCRGPNGTGPLCSGRGRCQCGRCACSGQSSGRLCECDDASCERHEGILCGGFGRCQCGVCHCHANRTGRACECSGDTDNCVSPEGRLCSGNGHCSCNRCQCSDGYYGALCDQCSGCKTPCETHRDCAECGAFGTGPLAMNCSMACAHANVTVTLTPIPDDGWCKERTQDNQLFFFLAEDEGGDRVVLRVRPPEKGADHTQILVLGCVGGIVAVGLALVLAYRLSVEIYDRREFSRFEKERQHLNWKQDSNPLYKSAITTTVNPRFQEAESHPL
ncbi:integrin beta-7 isoform X4 [Hippopotamus amphibius kiboko]|uniref:integrin beta-7 isoform X4 n=1 Tax=Hippopotamus amphibius kiboko TaxID=575201 RepID=UPI0025969A39|nr:integrin beta-7 isoform X4 [Hippopotamus amphibius kiboko]